jgi:hypothetical protein
MYYFDELKCAISTKHKLLTVEGKLKLTTKPEANQRKK